MAKKELSLDKIGFEYGNCQTYQISDDIQYLEIEYTQIYGVQKITFGTSEQTYSFGYEIDGQAKGTDRYEFGETSRWVGLHGVESPDGVEQIGIITMDPTCTPLGGEFIPI